MIANTGNRSLIYILWAANVRPLSTQNLIIISECIHIRLSIELSPDIIVTVYSAPHVHHQQFFLVYFVFCCFFGGGGVGISPSCMNTFHNYFLGSFTARRALGIANGITQIAREDLRIFSMIFAIVKS